MKKIVRLTESDLERLVKKVIKEDEQSKDKKTTLTRHPAYPAVDDLERSLEDLKMKFKDSIANVVSGADGYHSEIDKFSEDFGKFITKVSNLKSKINDYQIANKDKEMAEAKKRKEKQLQYQHYMREKARKEGKNYYSYKKVNEAEDVNQKVVSQIKSVLSPDEIKFLISQDKNTIAQVINNKKTMGEGGEETSRLKNIIDKLEKIRVPDLPYGVSAIPALLKTIGKEVQSSDWYEKKYGAPPEVKFAKLFMGSK